MKFKKGDKVRLVGAAYSVSKGMVGTITTVFEEDNEYQVSFPNVLYRYLFEESDLEAV